MLAFFSVFPAGKESLSKDVSAVLDIIDKSGIEYKLTAMGTLVEGEPDEVWGLIRRCHESMRTKAKRVFTHVHIDDREGASGRIRGKIEHVEKHLGRKLET